MPAEMIGDRSVQEATTAEEDFLVMAISLLTDLANNRRAGSAG